MPFIDRIANGLADAMDGEDGGLEFMAVEQANDPGYVVLRADGALDLKMIPPTAEFDPLVAPLGGLADQLLQGEISPVASVENHRTCHSGILSYQLSVISYQ